jgi:DnaJ homologue, subfamily C, member 28, conserved domain
MRFESIVEAAIQEAMARGDFDNLPGKGKPLDLTEYFNTPEDIRVGQAMLRNAGMLPVEVELVQELAVLKEKISLASEKGEKEKYRRILEDKQLQLNLHLEQRKRYLK